MASTDTIFALATGSLPSGIGIVRVSGPASKDLLRQFTGNVPPPRHATHCQFRSGGDVLDHGIALFFPGPGSVTGEDCAEFHVHGSVAVVKALTDALGKIPAVRLAEPGEFTRRALLNGRMDLTGVESLSDLIAAETEQQRVHALAGMSGQIRDVCLGWRQRIQTLRAGLEAELDFSDQEDVSLRGHNGLITKVHELVAEMQDVVARADQAEIVRSGYTIAIVGAPNAGKSSLLNALALRDVAIVTAEPGTTRDVVEVSLDIGGYKVRLQDTAGLRDAEGMIERIGIERARRAADEADLVLLLEDSHDPMPVSIMRGVADVVRVGTKQDLEPTADGYDVRISTVSGAGISALLEEIAHRMANRLTGSRPFPLRERHIRHIKSAISALEAIPTIQEPEFVAEELRFAAEEIGRIVGMGNNETLLGEIFSRFCIGK